MSDPRESDGPIGGAPRRTPLWLGGAALLALAVVLRLHGLTRLNLWLDEANTVRIARLGPAHMIPVLRIDAGAPLHYLLLWGWMHLFGEGEAAVRGLSVLFGVLLVPATGLLAARIGGARAGWCAAWLMAATPIAVQFSQETRMYTLLPLLAALAAERLLAYLETGSRGALAAHAACLVAACYTHNWGLFLLPAAAAAVAIHPRHRRRGWLLAAGGAIIAYLPWVPVLAAQLRSDSYLFVAEVQQPPAWQLPVRSLVLFASGVGTGGVTVGSLLGAAGGWVAAAGWVLLFAAGLGRPERRRTRVAVALMGAVPLACALASGAIGRPIYLLGRYEMLSLPLLLAAVAASAASIAPRRLLAGTVTLWVAMLAVGSYRYTGAIQRTDPVEAFSDLLAARLQPGDRVVFTGLYRACVEYYMRRAGARCRFASYPPEAGLHQGWYHELDYDADTPELIDAARALCPGAGQRTWIVVVEGTPTSARLLAELGACAGLERPFAGTGPPFDEVVIAVPPG